MSGLRRAAAGLGSTVLLVLSLPAALLIVYPRLEGVARALGAARDGWVTPPLNWVLFLVALMPTWSRCGGIGRLWGSALWDIIVASFSIAVLVTVLAASLRYAGPQEAFVLDLRVDEAVLWVPPLLSGATALGWGLVQRFSRGRRSRTTTG